MKTDIDVWVEAILEREEELVAADWLKEEPSATVAKVLARLRDAWKTRPELVLWESEYRKVQAYWSPCHSKWLFVSLSPDMLESTAAWIQLDGYWLESLDEDLDVLLMIRSDNPKRSYVVVRWPDFDLLEESLGAGMAITMCGTYTGRVLRGDAAHAWVMQQIADE